MVAASKASVLDASEIFVMKVKFFSKKNEHGGEHNEIFHCFLSRLSQGERFVHPDGRLGRDICG